MSRIPTDEFDNQQDQADNEDKLQDQGSQQVMQDEIEEALRNRKTYPEIKAPTGK
jgi:hypothetical protein